FSPLPAIQPSRLTRSVTTAPKAPKSRAPIDRSRCSGANSKRIRGLVLALVRVDSRGTLIPRLDILLCITRRAIYSLRELLISSMNKQLGGGLSYASMPVQNLKKRVQVRRCSGSTQIAHHLVAQWLL